MLRFVLPCEENRADVMDFYAEFEENGDTCIGFANRRDYDRWLCDMRNRHSGQNLPKGYATEMLRQVQESALPFVLIDDTYTVPDTIV